MLKPIDDMDGPLAVASEAILEFSSRKFGDSHRSDSIDTKASNTVVYKESQKAAKCYFLRGVQEEESQSLGEINNQSYTSHHEE